MPKGSECRAASSRRDEPFTISDLWTNRTQEEAHHGGLLPPLSWCPVGDGGCPEGAVSLGTAVHMAALLRRCTGLEEHTDLRRPPS